MKMFYWFCGFEDQVPQEEVPEDFVLTVDQKAVVIKSQAEVISIDKEAMMVTENNNCEKIQSFDFRDPSVRKQSSVSRASIWEDEDDQEEPIGFQDIPRLQERRKTLSTLAQSPKEKILLRTALAGVVFVGVFLYVYFSLPLRWRYNLKHP